MAVLTANFPPLNTGLFTRHFHEFEEASLILFIILAMDSDIFSIHITPSQWSSIWSIMEGGEQTGINPMVC